MSDYHYNCVIVLDSAIVAILSSATVWSKKILNICNNRDDNNKSKRILDLCCKYFLLDL